MKSHSDTAYDALADEYYDPVAHPTCHNLNRLSRVFLERHVPEPWSGIETLEVGAGDSCVAAILHSRGHGLKRLTLTDASEPMLRHSSRWQELGASLRQCDAHALAVDPGSVELLVASLGDPYNTAAFWAEAARVVQVSGRVLFTAPSFQWSVRFRGARDAHHAEFVLRDGRSLQVPSFILPLSRQIALMESVGFMTRVFESLGADDLHPTEIRSPKIDVFGAEKSSLVWGFELVRMSSDEDLLVP